MKNKAIINVSNLLYNVKTIKKGLNKNQKLYAVVKANAYGHGLERVANELNLFVDAFCVALLEEAISLRLSGITKPILLLVPPCSLVDYERGVLYDITFGVSSYNEIKKIERFAKKYKKVINIHIKVDTGMNRLGVNNLTLFTTMCRYLTSLKWLKFTGVYSHYYMPENDYERTKQKVLFDRFISIAKQYNANVETHISASGGYLKNDNYSAVRIGIMLYGYLPYESNKIKLKPVMTIQSYAIVSKNVFLGQNLLYGKNVVRSNKNISIIRFGYADGLPRRAVSEELSNRCMDLSALENKKNYTKINILYKNATQIAKKYGTICYEVLVNASKRCEFVYKK